jgi:uncharacterized protein (UPF0332 family)
MKAKLIREKADYGHDQEVASEVAQEHVANAERFLEKAAGLLRDLISQTKQK